MMNLSDPTNVKNYANSIELIKKLKKTIFTRREYVEACPFVHDAVTFDSLVNAGFLEVVDVDHFAKKYFQNGRWGDKEWLSPEDCEAIEDFINNLSNPELASAVEGAINGCVDSIECKRFFYRLKYNNIGEYIRGKMPWIVRALEGGVF